MRSIASHARVLAATIALVVTSSACATTAVEQQADIAGTLIGVGVVGAGSSLVIASGLGIAGALQGQSTRPLVEPAVPGIIGVGVGVVVAAAGIGMMNALHDDLAAEVAPVGTRQQIEHAMSGAHQRAVGTGFVVAGATALAATAAAAGFVLSQQGNDAFNEPFLVPAVALTGGIIGAIAMAGGIALRATAAPRLEAEDTLE